MIDEPVAGGFNFLFAPINHLKNLKNRNARLLKDFLRKFDKKHVLALTYFLHANNIPHYKQNGS